MEVTVDVREGVELPEQFDAEALIIHALEHMGVPAGCEVSVSFVTEQEIQDLNSEYRGIDNVTDVLSFECDDPWEADPDDPCIAIGDVVIAPSVIDEQRAQFGTSFLQEASLMTVHSILHLLGFDHMEPEERAEMEALEKEILEAYGIVDVR